MRHSFHLFLIVAMAAGLGACSKPATEPAPTPPATSTDLHESVADDEDAPEGDPCSLLEAKEVEAVLGQPLGTPPFVNEDKSEGGGCRYVGNDLREIDVEVTWSGATMVWKMFSAVQSAINQHMKGMLKLADGTELAGEWDEARVQTCCTFMALRGDQMVEVNVGGSKAGLKEAAALADAALKRIEKPLAIKGAGNAAAAKTFFASHRPAQRGACELVSRAEAESLIGPLAGDPVAGEHSCRYPLPMRNNLNSFVDLKIRWEGGYRELRENAGISDGVSGGFGLKGLSELPEELAKIVGPVSWEALHMSIGEFQAVKKDVLISTDNRTAPSGAAEKMVAKAMSKI